MNIRRRLAIFLHFACACAISWQANASPGGIAPTDAALNEVAPAVVRLQSREALVQGPALNQCVYYTYDKNGNRLKQESVPITGGDNVWGAAKYLCFVWGS